MAANTGIRACHAALTGGGTADTFDLIADGFDWVEITHHGDVDEVVYFRTDGTAAVAAADENRLLLPHERLTLPCASGGAHPTISVVAATGSPTISVEGL